MLGEFRRARQQSFMGRQKLKRLALNGAAAAVAESVILWFVVVVLAGGLVGIVLVASSFGLLGDLLRSGSQSASMMSPPEASAAAWFRNRPKYCDIAKLWHSSCPSENSRIASGADDKLRFKAVAAREATTEH